MTLLVPLLLVLSLLLIEVVNLKEGVLSILVIIQIIEDSSVLIFESIPLRQRLGLLLHLNLLSWRETLLGILLLSLLGAHLSCSSPLEKTRGEHAQVGKRGSCCGGEI